MLRVVVPHVTLHLCSFFHPCVCFCLFVLWADQIVAHIPPCPLDATLKRQINLRMKNCSNVGHEIIDIMAMALIPLSSRHESRRTSYVSLCKRSSVVRARNSSLVHTKVVISFTWTIDCICRSNRQEKCVFFYYLAACNGKQVQWAISATLRIYHMKTLLLFLLAFADCTTEANS